MNGLVSGGFLLVGGLQAYRNFFLPSVLVYSIGLAQIYLFPGYVCMNAKLCKSNPAPGCQRSINLSIYLYEIPWFLESGHGRSYLNYLHTIYPIQFNVNNRAQVFLFARIFYNITFTYKLKHLRFQLTRNENFKEQLDQASVCLDDF